MYILYHTTELYTLTEKLGNKGIWVSISIWTPVRFAVCLGLLRYLTPVLHFYHFYLIICLILELIKPEYLAKTVLTLFSTRVKMSPNVNPFIELATVLDATPQNNCCMIKTNKNTYICSIIL